MRPSKRVITPPLPVAGMPAYRNLLLTAGAGKGKGGGQAASVYGAFPAVANGEPVIVVSDPTVMEAAPIAPGRKEFAA